MHLTNANSPGTATSEVGV